MPQPVPPAPLRFVDSSPMRLLGIWQDVTSEPAETISSLWDRFARRPDALERRASPLAYGVCAASADGNSMSYAAAVAVTGYDDADADAGLVRIELPAARYAVFAHEGHVSELHDTFAYVASEWLPSSGARPADAAALEVYGERFDPATGLGGVEVWIPLEA